MELSGVFALALVGFVTGTPYGYGVKSGAVAKAEANAAAGAFGVHPAVPLSIPSGSGFSGSFSKSSSSSFASASSSASSSSSSYSFSGSGTNGIAGFGCQTNNCKEGGNSAPSTLHSSSGNIALNNGGVVHGNGKSAGIIPYTPNGVSTPCTGNNCNGYSNTANKCSTGDCNGVTGNQQNPSFDLPSSNDNYGKDTNCASGQCNTELQNGKSQNGYESPNKCISGNCSPSSQQHKDSTSNSYSYGADSTGKTQSQSTYGPSGGNNGGYSHSQTDCSQGKCGSSPSSGVSSPSDEHDIFIPLEGNEARPTYPKPDIHLNTPSQGPACTSHSCRIPPSGPDSISGKLPTSYNVPILGTNPSTTYSVPGTNSNPTGNLYDFPKGTSSTSNCGSSICSTGSASPVNTASIPSKPSTYSHGNYPSQVSVAPAVSPSCIGSNCKTLNTPDSEIPVYQTGKPTNCNTPDCAHNPAIGSSASEYPSNIDSPKPSYTGAPSPSESFKTPIPNAKVDSSHYHNHNAYPGYENIPVTPESAIHPSISNERPINGGGSTATKGSYNAEAQGSFDTKFDEKFKTNIETSSQNKPSHGILETSKAHFDIGPPAQYTPIYTGGFGGSPGSFYTGSVIGTQLASKPTHEKAPASSILPHITGPADDASESNSYPDLHGLSNPSGTFIPPYQNIPTGPSPFGQSHGPTTVVQTGPAGLPKPIDEKAKLPQYMGGFGGAPGSFDTSSPIGTQFASKPSHEKAPSHSNLPHTSGVSSSAGANSGSHSYHGLQGISKPSGSITPPNQNFPTGPATFGETHRPTTVLQTGPASLPKPIEDKAKLPSYTGGFGGAPGSFETSSPIGTQFASKPSHEKAPSTSNLPHASGVGGPTSSAGANSGSHSYPGLQGIAKPSGSLTPPYQSFPPGSGSFGETHGPTTAFQSGPANLPKPIDDKTKLPSYTGGFGGAPGSFDTSSPVGIQFASKPSHEKAPSTSNLPHTSGVGGPTDSAGANSGSHSYPGVHGISKPSGSLVSSNQNYPTGSGSFGETHRPTTVLQTGSSSLPKPIDDKGKLPSYTGGFGGSTGVLKPNEYVTPKSPASPSNNLTPTSCSSGSCNSKGGPNLYDAHQTANGGSSISSASADAKAVAYSGGFGGPPGFLKPFDDGKNSKSRNFGNEENDHLAGHDHYNTGAENKNKATSNSNQVNSGAQSNGGAHANAGASSSAGAQAIAGAQANAVAFASSGGFGTNQGTGCQSGCADNYNYGAGQNFASSRSLGISQTGGYGDIHNVGAGASASAKSVAGAGTGVFGAGHGFASSSAAAHSSAGAAVKGGYGR